MAADGTTTVVNRRDGNQASDEFSLIEYNFSLFFGLAVQMYEATLVSDDTPFDRFLRDPGNNPLSEAAERGRQVFFNLNAAPAPRGNCAFCHSGSLLSEASVDSVAARGMIRNAGGQFSDTGTRNIGVRETTDDLGNGGLDPFGFSLSVAVRDAAGTPLAADGTFKIPGLRNVELTAPYFHNGGEATLLDVVNFYARGGNQGGGRTRSARATARSSGDSRSSTSTRRRRGRREGRPRRVPPSLTDERVRIAAAPFDHPQLFVPNGHPGNEVAVIQRDGQALDAFPRSGDRPNGWPGAARLPGGLSSLRARRPALEAGRRASTLAVPRRRGAAQSSRASASPHARLGGWTSHQVLEPATSGSARKAGTQSRCEVRWCITGLRPSAVRPSVRLRYPA